MPSNVEYPCKCGEKLPCKQGRRPLTFAMALKRKLNRHRCCPPPCDGGTLDRGKPECGMPFTIAAVHRRMILACLILACPIPSAGAPQRPLAGLPSPSATPAVEDPGRQRAA